MAFTGNVSTAYIEEYKNTVYDAVQTTGSKFRGKLVEETIGGEAKNYEVLTGLIAKAKGARHSATVITDPSHGRRKVYPSDYEVASLIDLWDNDKVLVDFRSPYVMMQSIALNRKRDIEVFKAALGTAQAETDGVPETVAFDFANQSVDVTLGGNGLTIEKLAEARTLLEEAGYDLEDPMSKPYFVVAPRQIPDLLGTVEVGSIDYNTVKALTKGDVNSFYGFEFIKSNLVPYVSATTDNIPTGVELDWDESGEYEVPKDTAGTGIRACFAYVRKSLTCATNPDLDASIDKRPDLRNSWQAYSRLGTGGVRMEEKGVVLVGCS